MEENAKADKEVPIEEPVLEEPVSEEPVSEEPVSEEPEAPAEEPVLEPEGAVSEEPEVVEMEAPVIEPIGKETPEEARNVRELEGILQHAAEGPKKVYYDSCEGCDTSRSTGQWRGYGEWN